MNLKDYENAINNFKWHKKIFIKHGIIYMNQLAMN